MKEGRLLRSKRESLENDERGRGALHPTPTHTYIHTYIHPSIHTYTHFRIIEKWPIKKESICNDSLVFHRSKKEKYTEKCDLCLYSFMVFLILFSPCIQRKRENP